MSIRRGAPWGAAAVAPPGTPVVGDDAALSALVEHSILSGDDAAGTAPAGPVVLTGGDLHRTLGAPSRRGAAGEELLRFDCDVLRGSGRRGDGELVRFTAVAHVVGRAPGLRRAGRSLWSGRSFVATSAAFCGRDNLGPRAHPGDGLVDVSWGSLEGRDRRRARRRSRTGTHLPHPGIRETRTRSWEIEEPYVVHVDGRCLGVLEALRVEVVPDGVVVLV